MARQSNEIQKRAPIPSLDRIDGAILAALAKNARLTNKELAGALGLAQSSCLERVRRLVRAGVLRGFHADIDLAAMGHALEAMVMVDLARHSQSTYRALREHLLGLAEVLDVYYVTGRHDFLVHVAARDVDHLRDFVVERIGTRKEVGRVETSIVFEHVRTRGPLEDGAPDAGNEEAGASRGAARRTTARSRRSG